MTERQRAALEAAKQQHYLVAPANARALRKAYWDYCTARPWHPYIRVSMGAKYATVSVNPDSVRDEQGDYVLAMRDDAKEEEWAVFHRLFEATRDRWARNGLVMGGFARGMPVECVPTLMEALWPIISQPSAWVYHDWVVTPDDEYP